MKTATATTDRHDRFKIVSNNCCDSLHPPSHHIYSNAAWDRKSNKNEERNEINHVSIPIKIDLYPLRTFTREIVIMLQLWHIDLNEAKISIKDSVSIWKQNFYQHSSCALLHLLFFLHFWFFALFHSIRIVSFACRMAFFLLTNANSIVFSSIRKMQW